MKMSNIKSCHECGNRVICKTYHEATSISYREHLDFGPNEFDTLFKLIAINCKYYKPFEQNNKESR